MSELENLKANSGLDIRLDVETCQLGFGNGLTAPEPVIRYLGEMQEVILDGNINKPQELYYMYRDVHQLADSHLLEKNNLRYDLTVIKPDYLGKELMKTAGHYHPDGFGELYEIVSGRAFCLLQKPQPLDYTVIEDVVLVEAEAGEKIVVPPGYGHILVNPGPMALVTSNWVSSRFQSEYDLYKKAKGAAYYLVGTAERQEFIKNPFFKKLPKIKFVKPAQELAKFGLKKGSPIYPIVTRDAAKLDFLNQPQNYDYKDIFVNLQPRT